MNLFWKIFLSFWLTLALILVVSVIVTAHMAERRHEALENFTPDTLITGGSEALRNNGIDGLREVLRDAQSELPEFDLYIIDASGTEILGRELSRRMLRRMRHLSRRQPRLPPNFRPPRFVPRFVGPDGEEYALLIEPRERLWGALGTRGVPFTVGLIAIAISTLFCWLLARYLTGPVRRLQATSQQLAAGRLDARVGIGKRRDELADLARDFDTMADRLQALIESRQRLLTDISHELRSPLARLRLALGLAQRTPTDNETQLHRIEHEAERLDDMIGHVLSMNRLDDPQRAIEKSPIEIDDLLTGIVADARIEADARGCEIEYDADSRCNIHGDPFLLRSAIENVLRNAIKYTDAGSKVSVNLVGYAEQVHIEIRDHGPGVPETELERIFEPFYRVSSSRTRDSGGEGIGLAIAARVTRVHGGSIEAQNAADGGLVVHLHLPR